MWIWGICLLKLNEFIVIPNHIHAIFINGDNKYNTQFHPQCRDAMHCVSTINCISTKRGGITGMKNPMLSDNLSIIIRWYKGRVSFESRKTHADFGWQARFHDHIIRNDESVQKIKDYISNNPLTWTDDKFHTTN